ncbi:hypothetical protein DXC92_27840 [Clostridiales bacterium TF09-2AC]|uniref:hypothetical protein n=1 Tax=Enterocloster hominis (ex Hitch et al. 2024) TaxID=1917870 RepID=UPI000E757910|nr:hypothetical protein [Lachnoclostridium pacaense]MCC2820241.1 hypothetical protein [Lachnoclostridium pacaense]RJW33270.1 hypothetical protein DXC92_27840 [Clostridiales bacterium TF09-2AC]
MEYKVRLILDGEYHKLLVSRAGSQIKIVVGRTDEMSVVGARKCVDEVKELLEEKCSLCLLKRMHYLISVKNQLGEKRDILRFSLKSLEIAIRILYPDEYRQWKDEIEEKGEKGDDRQYEKKRITILNTGCTSSGKTIFDLKCILDDAASKNFIPALTSIKESTNFMIRYHINDPEFRPEEGMDFRICVKLKTKQVLKKNIEMQILEAVVEMYEDIAEMTKDDNAGMEEIREHSRGIAVERLKSNRAKTFVIGYIVDMEGKGKNIENILIKGIQEVYGQSTSYSKVGYEEAYGGIITDIRSKHLKLSNDDISELVFREDDRPSEYMEIYNYIERELDRVAVMFEEEHGRHIGMGDNLQIEGKSREPGTKDLVDHVFGNKRRQMNKDFFSIEPLVERAELYFVSDKMKDCGCVVLIDGLGINQGQLPSGNEKEVIYNRVHVSVQDANPDIILYHTLLNGKDDHMLDIVRMLSDEGFRRKTYVVFGRLDTVADDYFEQDGIGLDEVTSEEFGIFMKHIEEQYAERDVLSLRGIIGEHYFLCDKMGTFDKKMDIPEAKGYDSNSVIKEIIRQNAGDISSQAANSDMEQFFMIMDKHFVFGSTYIKYMSELDRMVPMEYGKMRWNTLEKALDELYASRWGFDCLIPSMTLRRCLAGIMNREDIKKQMQDTFADRYDSILRDFLQEWTETAQTIMVIEHKAFFHRLLLMRYISSMRTTYGVSMTTDRKINLRNLYERCFGSKDMDGMETLRLMAQIAWKSKRSLNTEAGME